MKRLLACVLIMLFVAGMALGGTSFAQEEETISVYGRVVSVEGNTITISEVMYDEEMDEENYREATYTITENVELENIDWVEALEAGKEVDIEYTEKDGGKEISYIYVYTGEEE